MYDLVVKDGQVVSGGGTLVADIGVRDGRIASIGLDLLGDQVLDASGCYVIPGGVDPHVHLQMQLAGRVSSDSFMDGTRAAICGGTTTVIDFADPQPSQSLLFALAERKSIADASIAADYGLHVTIPTWHAADTTRMSEIGQVVAAGCPTFKLYQAYAGMELDDVSLLQAFQQIARAEGRVVLHSEMGPVLDYLRAQALAAGHKTPIWHERTRPADLEASSVQRAILLAELAGCALHIFHVGAQQVVEEIVRAQARRLPVTAETCPQYLCLTAKSELGGPQGELFVCAPPLRSGEDQESLWVGLADGSLDVVSTDHCPWLKTEKMASDFTLIPGGVPGIEARLSIVHELGVQTGRLSVERWVEVCCTLPARLMGLHRKGILMPGYDADIVLFDPTQRKEICVDNLHETAGWTPYDGMVVHGWPRTVLLRGNVVVRDGEVVDDRAGRFVHRTFMREESPHSIASG